MPDPSIWAQLLLQLVLILVNAFFASAEIAVISLNENKLRKLSEAGDKTAARMLKMVENPDGFLSTIQIGITLAGFLGSAFAADNLASRLKNFIVRDLGFTALSEGTINTLAIILITLLLSYFTLVLGELVPKRIAMKKPEKVASICAGVITVISKIMKPVIWLLSASTGAILRILGIDPENNSSNVTEEEIRLMVDAGEEKGAIEPGEKELIDNIFEFNNITAADIMTPRTEISAIPADASNDAILEQISESGFSRFPVYEDDIDNIIGFVTSRQFLLNICSQKPLPLGKLLFPAYFVPESVPADALFRDMQKKKIHIAVVLDEYGGTSGIITMEDLLEEIVGNIYDESDEQDEPEIKRVDKNLWKVKGSCELDVVEDALGLKLASDDDDFATIGGLIFGDFTVIPDDGETPEADIRGLIHVKVLSIVDHRIEWALISKITGKSE